ncbi:MFS transporter [Streptomyces sp. TR1341]|uniref:MFS family permease n=1 Tax=Streptomyces murinus TaxID=33900 RepID=A0A7W3RMB1_STRMR|nr:MULTISPECIES: MFS transporter [Streptomyces]MBA9054194.1 MFS family permease [Streptomyces murinus]NDK26713.1 MFS transporter [Streptomyces sp. TR1341]UWW95228.1 MFS transporter [Streptomyces murinus]WSI85995.1 MFS transporter [Streptomyces murinus]
MSQQLTTSPVAPAATPLPVGRSGRTHSPRYKWGILGIGVVAQAAFSAAFQGIPMASAVLQSDYHYSTGQLGLVLAALTCGAAVTEIIWGLLTDRFGERMVLITGLAGTTACLAAATAFLVPTGGYTPPSWLLSAVLLLAGALGGCVNSASGRAVLGWFPPGNHGFAISLRVAAVPLGGAIGALALPALAMSVGFRGVYGFLTAFALVATVIIVCWLDEPPLPAAGHKNTTVSPLRRWKIWRISLSAFLLDFPQFTVLSFAAIYLHKVHGVGITAISGLLFVVQALGAVSRVWSGRWTDSRGGRHRRTLVIAYSWIIAVCFVGLALCQSGPAWIAAALMVVAGLLSCGWHGVHYAEIAIMAGKERSGTALGLENTMVFAGAFLTPLVIPGILSATNWPVVMLLIGAVPAVLSAVVMPREGK